MLACSIRCYRIAVPARGPDCAHRTAFDLKTFLSQKPIAYVTFTVTLSVCECVCPMVLALWAANKVCMNAAPDIDSTCCCSHTCETCCDCSMGLYGYLLGLCQTLSHGCVGGCDCGVRSQRGKEAGGALVLDFYAKMMICCAHKCRR